MGGVSLNTDAELRVWLDEIFESKASDFYQRCYENLVELWKEVINNNNNGYF